MKVFMLPKEGQLGIGRVVAAYRKYLPQHGIEFVDDAAIADLVVVHAAESSQYQPDIAHCHGLHPTSEDNHNFVGYYQTNASVLRNVKAAKLVTVPSKWVAEIFQRDMLIDPKVLPHGIEPDEWPCVIDKHQDYVLWGKGHDAPVCDYEVVNRLAAKMPAYKFVSTLGTAADNVQVIGAQPYDMMKRWLASAGVYLATTKETCGIQTMEAMACGVPVVGWKWGGTADLVTHRENGWLVKAGDYDGLVEGVVWALLNRKVVGNNARAAAETHTWSGVCSSLATMYYEINKRCSYPVDLSVVIPCHNYAQYVGQAIESVLSQEFGGGIEIIVVDDDSTDNSAEVIAKYPVQYIKLEHSGVSAARNAGISKASGEFVTCLDADDYLEPNFIKDLLPIIQSSRDIGIVYGGRNLLSGDNKHVVTWPPQFDYSLQVTKHNCVPTANIMRKEAWSRAGGYRKQYEYCEDAELWTRMTSLGFRAIKVTESPVYTNRVHEGSNYGTMHQETAWVEDKPWSRNTESALMAAIPSMGMESYKVRNYDDPWVSVVIPVGPGHENLVHRAVDSVWLQSMPYWEVIVVNDSGQEMLTPIGQRLQQAYPFVRIANTPHRGPAVARNMGASMARSEFLVFLDADDSLSIDYLDNVIKAYNSNPDVYIYTDWIERAGNNLVNKESRDFDCARLYVEALHPVTGLVPKSWHTEVGGFDESLPGWEDWDYYMKLAKAGHCGLRLEYHGVIYDTTSGMRRDENYAKAKDILPYIRAKHKESEMCGPGCNSARQNKSALVPERSGGAPLGTSDVGGMVTVIENSGNKGMHGVFGVRSRRNYGNFCHGQEFDMLAVDQAAQQHLYILKNKVVQSTQPAARPVAPMPIPMMQPQQPSAPPQMPAQPPVPPPPQIQSDMERMLKEAGTTVQAAPDPAALAAMAAANAAKPDDEGVDISLLNLSQIKKLGIDSETASAAYEAEAAGKNRPEVLVYLSELMEDD